MFVTSHERQKLQGGSRKMMWRGAARHMAQSVLNMPCFDLRGTKWQASYKGRAFLCKREILDSCKGNRGIRKDWSDNETSTHTCMKCTPSSEATAWKLLLKPKVHAYFTAMFKSQEPNLYKIPATRKNSLEGKTSKSWAKWEKELKKQITGNCCARGHGVRQGTRCYNPIIKWNSTYIWKRETRFVCSFK